MKVLLPDRLPARTTWPPDDSNPYCIGNSIPWLYAKAHTNFLHPPVLYRMNFLLINAVGNLLEATTPAIKYNKIKPTH